MYAYMHAQVDMLMLNIFFFIHQVNVLKNMMKTPKYKMLKNVSVLPTYLVQGI